MPPRENGGMRVLVDSNARNSKRFIQAPALGGGGGGEKATAGEGLRADGEGFAADHRQTEIWSGREG